jgi:hypothetical protein
MAAFAELNRRRLLGLLAGLLAVPAAARTLARAPGAADEIVIIDGWVLRASDLEKAALHAA